MMMLDMLRYLAATVHALLRTLFRRLLPFTEGPRHIVHSPDLGTAANADFGRSAGLFYAALGKSRQVGGDGKA